MEGVYTAIVTPFGPAGRGIDEKFFRTLIERQINGGVTGLIISGSTGEGQTLTLDEWKTSLQIALQYKGKVQIIGACGSSGTDQTVERFKMIADMGASAALVSTPPYNKAPQRGLIKHFETIAASNSLPILVYNIPGRTAVNLLPATIRELWKIPTVVSIKESSGNWDQIVQIVSELPTGKTFLSGDDPFNLPVLSIGGHGTVSVLSNVAPKALVQLCNEFKKGDIAKAREINHSLSDFIPLLFSESNPIPVKWCMGQILGADLPPRLPLVPLDEAHHAKLKAGLNKLRSLGFIE